MVLSGINQGANLGTDVLYSGTVSAAMEGVIEGIPAIALSLNSFAYPDFKPAAHFAQQLLATIQDHPLPELLLLNVNIPPVRTGDIKGCVIARQGVRRYIDSFEKRIDPRGKTYYWLAGEVLEPVEHDEDSYQLLAEKLQQLPQFQGLEQIPTDVIAIQQNWITMTPLQYNLTSHLGIGQLQAWQAQCDLSPHRPDSSGEPLKS